MRAYVISTYSAPVGMVRISGKLPPSPLQRLWRCCRYNISDVLFRLKWVINKIRNSSDAKFSKTWYPLFLAPPSSYSTLTVKLQILRNFIGHHGWVIGPLQGLYAYIHRTKCVCMYVYVYKTHETAIFLIPDDSSI